ncbi:MAG: esterase family protein [Spirochaetaceae bacterium]|jgi:S-formylglutathione hydrolase FrmB|nr:esterase family protein [Spirochaetaceae bacterium]
MMPATFTHRSYYLGMDMPVTVLLPDKQNVVPALENERRYPVLYLLHGHGDDNTAWLRKSRVEMTLSGREFIIVMPCAHRSFYTNAKAGHLFFDYITKELPMVTANTFHASTKPKEQYIAGLSMGGYGALKIAFSYPEIYAACGALSAAVDPYQSWEAIKNTGMKFTVPDCEENTDRVFGGEEAFRHSETDNIYKLAGHLQGKETLRVYHACALSDPLYVLNQELKSALEQNSHIEYHYEECEGGHDWIFWDRQIEAMVNFMRITTTYDQNES